MRATLMRDIRSTFREIRSRPEVYVVIILTLALGIGINTMFFTLLNGMVLRPLPFERPHELVVINESQPALNRTQALVAPATLRDWRLSTDALSAVASYQQRSYDVHADQRPERIGGARVSVELFPLLGLSPALGRNFVAEEDRPGGRPVALIGDGLWERQFGRDPRVIGRQIYLDDQAHEIVGVMPKGCRFPHFAEVWTPLALDPADPTRDRRFLEVIARLAPGSQASQVQASLQQVSERLAAEYAATNEGWSVSVRPLRDAWLPPVAQFSSVAQQIQVSFVLLIACANVTGLMLARAAARRYEFAVKAALGASRGGLVRQFLTEGVILGLLGGSVGLLMALWGDRWLKALIQVPIPYWLRFEFDRTALLFAVAISLVAGACLSLLPGLRYSRMQVVGVLRSAGHYDEGRAGQRLRKLLVIGQFALSATLLVGALLMIKSFVNAEQRPVGYESRDVLTLRFSMNGASYEAAPQRLRFVRDSVNRIRALGAVTSAGVVNHLPAVGYDAVAVEIDGQAFNRNETRSVSRQIVSTGYLETLRVPLFEGRGFDEVDIAEARPVAIVGSNVAKQLWPGESAVGKRLRLVRGDSPWLTVIGVVGDVEPGLQVAGMDAWPRTQVYVPYGLDPVPVLALALRINGDPMSAAADVRSAVQALDPTLPIFDVLTMPQVLDRANWIPRLWSQLFSMFSVLALLMTAAGTFSMSAYAVSRRTREIGVRMAMGAQPNGILRSILRDATVLCVVGTVLGLMPAVLMSRLLARLLYGVAPYDPQVFGAVALLLTTVSLLAAYLPARRGAHLDPLRALRAD